MKKILLCFTIVILLHLPDLKLMHLVDLTHGVLPEGVFLEYSPLRILLEPLVGPAEYFFSLKDCRIQVQAWFFWLAAISVLVALFKRKRLMRVIGTVLSSWLSFVTFIVFLMILPLPATRLSADKDWIRVDFHSHSWYSYDGIISPLRNLRFHHNLGFDCFFITEHDNVNSYPAFTLKDRSQTVFPGIEMVSSDGFRILILADREFSESEFTPMKLAEIIYTAHEKGFMVICPHYLTKEKEWWHAAAMQGVDGFEIFDSGDFGLFHDEMIDLIHFCQERNLLMVGSTDTHGWSALSNVWTLVRKPENVAPTAKMLLERLRKRTEVRVVTYQQNTPWFGRESILDPFASAIRYFGGLNIAQTMSWAGWILTLMMLHRMFGWSRLLRWGILILVLYMLVYAAFMVLTMYFIQSEDSILGNLVALPLTILAGIWFYAWRFLSARASQKTSVDSYGHYYAYRYTPFHGL